MIYNSKLQKWLVWRYLGEVHAEGSEGRSLLTGILFVEMDDGAQPLIMNLGPAETGGTHVNWGRKGQS